MSEQEIVISTPDGKAPARLFTPSGNGPWPGVIMLTDVWGLRADTDKMGRRVAAAGYAVLMPHIFYRDQPIEFDPFLTGGQRGPAAAQPLLASMPPARMVSDGVAYVDALLARPEVSGKKVAVVGYCFSGAMAVRTAAAVPDKVATAASFHGGRLVTDAPDSPHMLVGKVKGELYFGHAVEDQSATPEMVAVLEEALKASGNTFTSEFYEGAKHGWTVEGGPAYNAAQAERHYEKLLDLLKRNLGRFS